MPHFASWAGVDLMYGAADCMYISGDARFVEQRLDDDRTAERGAHVADAREVERSSQQAARIRAIERGESIEHEAHVLHPGIEQRR